MTIDADKLIEQAVRDAIRETIKTRFAQSYDNPLDKLMKAAVEANAGAFRELMTDALHSCIGDPAFRDDVKAAVRSTLARTLVQRFGGELEKQVNALKSDPATRARITVAIEDIVSRKG